MDEDIEWLGGGESDPEKWFEGSATKAEAAAWLTSSQEENKEVEWVESSEKTDKDKDEVEWLGTTKKSSEEEERLETSCSNDGWFLTASKEVGEVGDSHIGGQWFEASVEDLGQLEIFELPPALNVHVEVTTGELTAYYQMGQVDGLDKNILDSKR